MDNVFIEQIWRSDKYEGLSERNNTWQPNQALGNKTRAQVYESDQNPAAVKIEKAS